jgi:peptidoglycan/xylan/chitin deacetylase (PgdA/CDA1 family)
MSLSELSSELSSNRRAKRAAVITVDDGFANSLLVGEIANDFHLPWSLFISTGVVGGETTLWPLELALLVLHGHAAHVEALDQVWSLSTRTEREVGFRSILRATKAMPSNSRRMIMDHLRQQFPKNETSRLLFEYPTLRMLSWTQIRQLAVEGVEIASHGVNHEIHHSDQAPDTRWNELTESKAELTKRLNSPCKFFAFPNGEFTTTSASEVQRAGYDLGFTTEPTSVVRTANPFILPRLYPAGPFQQLAHDFFWQSR